MSDGVYFQNNRKISPKQWSHYMAIRMTIQVYMWLDTQYEF